MRRVYIRQRGFQIAELWEGQRLNLYKTDASVKSNLRENFPYKSPLSANNSRKELPMGNSLDTFNVIMNFRNTRDVTLQNFLRYSEIP